MTRSLGPLFGDEPLPPHSAVPGRFDGLTYDPQHDGPRLARQLAVVRGLMRDGRWWTLTDLALAAACSTQSASARVRDLRKPKFGGAVVERRRVAGGLYEYRVRP